MHPENTKPLTPGQLFITTPDGNKVPLHYNMAEIEPTAEPDHLQDETGRKWLQPDPPPTITIELAPGPEYDAWIYAQGQLYLQAVNAAAEKLKDDIISWAQGNRPEWLNIACRTKKKRTRAKYAKRILRAYREAMEK